MLQCSAGKRQEKGQERGRIPRGANTPSTNTPCSAQNQGPKPRFLVFCALGGAQGIKTPKTLVPSFFGSKNGKSPRKVSSGHGFASRPLNWLWFFAENPFPATPGPGEAKKIKKITWKISKKSKKFLAKKPWYQNLGSPIWPLRSARAGGGIVESPA